MSGVNLVTHDHGPTTGLEMTPARKSELAVVSLRFEALVTEREESGGNGRGRVISKAGGMRRDEMTWRRTLLA